MKFGKHMIHLSDFNIRYVHSSLSKLGLIAKRERRKGNIAGMIKENCFRLPMNEIPLRRPAIHDSSRIAGMLRQKTSEEEESNYGESIDLENTDGEDNDEDNKDYSSNDEEGHDDEEMGDQRMQVRGSRPRAVDENYDKFDDIDEEMDMEHYGQGTYTGGLANDEWNAWQ
ncbi:hypothetical protein VP01_6935g1 [Puccinia sorghi]|uniref:Uncharacterized protein n=1 Tax=Puccinia sorghi TaxID=27349 RepID=A0A0L6UE16_9BASI|nr:hypothetical protein VP01_6935g1 [Puccinia sorghi]